jgi:DNA-binding MarR family transcriptional regulator
MGSPLARKSTSLSTVDALAQLAFLVQGTLERRAAERDVSIISIRLLGVLRDRRPTMNELAKFLDLDKSSVTGLVDRAERRGLVLRTPSTSDRRAVLVSLTAEGRALASRVTVDFEADVATLLGSLSAADQTALTALASRILIAHADEQGIDLFATSIG